MRYIDWSYLRRPLLIFGVTIVLSALMVALGFHFEKVQEDQYRQSLTTLRSTHTLYRNVINDIDLLDQYRNQYNDYKSSGLVGKERRLSWIESLEATNSVLRLPTLTYRLQPQEKFERPDFKVKRGVEVNSSPMELSMGILHEEDLFALLEGLRQSIRNLFTVDFCTMNRQSDINRSLNTKRPNIVGRCQIRWITIDAK